MHKMWTEIPSIPLIIFWVNHRNLYSLILCYIPQHNIAWYCLRGSVLNTPIFQKYDLFCSFNGNDSTIRELSPVYRSTSTLTNLGCLRKISCHPFQLSHCENQRTQGFVLRWWVRWGGSMLALTSWCIRWCPLRSCCQKSPKKNPHCYQIHKETKCKCHASRPIPFAREISHAQKILNGLKSLPLLQGPHRASFTLHRIIYVLLLCFRICEKMT